MTGQAWLVVARADRSARVRWMVVLVLVAGAGGCRACGSADTLSAEPQDAEPPWDVAPAAQPVRPGMVWIPAGTLVAGTPPGRVPRIADEEMAAVAIDMHGFFIDRYNHPPEPGGIPLTSITHEEARAICAEQEKRLCTELEWERACKGPENRTYEYGESYDENACATGSGDGVAPNGVNARCESGFGVRDMHGSAWNWTSSAWDRGSKEGRIAVRGGSGADGELVARCAHARGVDPARREKTIGVRCCAGEVNEARVSLDVERGPTLEYRLVEADLRLALEALVPEAITERVEPLGPAARFRVNRLWIWRPIGNEELVLGGGCARPGGHDACGVLVTRMEGDRPQLLLFVSSDWWIPTVGDAEGRHLYVYGGDVGGAYRKLLSYAWGRVVEGDKYRKRRGNWEVPSSPE